MLRRGSSKNLERECHEVAMFRSYQPGAMITQLYCTVLVMHPKNDFLSPYLTSMYYKMLANKPMYFMSTTRNVDENGEIDKYAYMYILI